MGSPAKGAVVLVAFPFSDLSASKVRPAVVLADAGRGDYVLCQVTSNPYSDEKAILLEEADFESGSLQRKSFARPGKLFTAHESLVEFEAGRLVAEFFRKLLDAVVEIIRPDSSSKADYQAKGE